MSERDRMRTKALEYARSQGWSPPPIAPAPNVLLVDPAIVMLQADLAKADSACADLRNSTVKLAQKIAELERRLGERAPHLRKRIAALETALRQIANPSDESYGQRLVAIAREALQ